MRRTDGPISQPGGVVVVTLFECRTLRLLLRVWWMHYRIKPAIRRAAPAFLGVRLYVDWPARRLRSVSLWSAAAGLFDMGQVKPHVRVAHLTTRWGIDTSCGVFSYAGDWREVMFGGTYVTASPLAQTQKEESMAIPTDRGYVLVRSAGDGTSQVEIYNGRPVTGSKPYATYSKVGKIVRKTNAGFSPYAGGELSRQPIEVTSGQDGAVYLVD